MLKQKCVYIFTLLLGTRKQREHKFSLMDKQNVAVLLSTHKKEVLTHTAAWYTLEVPCAVK